MKTFKTPKGTELPILDLRGKDYVQVAHRLVWFREERPEWGIETEILVHEKDRSVVRAHIKNEAGRLIAQATKQEDTAGFKDHLEKAETGAIGRALALIGYGTQFAPDLDEEARIVDSPLVRGNQPPPDGFASEAQVKRLIAIQLKAGLSDAGLKEMASAMGIKSRNEIPKNKYPQLCTLVENYKPII